MAGCQFALCLPDLTPPMVTNHSRGRIELATLLTLRSAHLYQLKTNEKIGVQHML